VFHQRRDFASTFTSIGAGRASESLTLDQYAVPSLATGFLQQWRLPVSETHTLALASDVMFTEGKTQERFRNLGAGFTREREAGGNQTNAGISLADTLTMVTSTPARMIGLEEKIGALLPGLPADLVHLGPDHALLSVYQQGIRLD
jgi:predicted amidohydrolase YtcJ